MCVLCTHCRPGADSSVPIVNLRMSVRVCIGLTLDQAAHEAVPEVEADGTDFMIRICRHVQQGLHWLHALR